MKRLGSLALIALGACGVRDLSMVTPEVAREAPKGSAPPANTEMVFALRDHEQHEDGRQTFSLCALHGGESVGFDLELGAWSANGPGFVDVTTLECQGRLLSQGAPSDAWLRVMDSVYGTGLKPARMAESVEIRAVTLGEDPGDFRGGRVILTLVLPPTMEVVEDPQVHLSLDLPAGRAHWRELHRQLRRAVVASLRPRAEYAAR